MSRSLRLRLGFGLVAGMVVLVDQVTKHLIDRFMALHDSRAIIPGLLHLTPVHNRGAAFGFLSNVEFSGQAGLLALVSLVALAVILLYALWLPATRVRPQVALALVLGGAVGNLIDRLTLGYVVDFVDLFWRTHHWPMFNAADSAISVGVALLVLDMLREPGREPQEKRSREAEAESAGRSE